MSPRVAWMRPAQASTWAASRRGTPPTRAATWPWPWGRVACWCRWGPRRSRCSGLAPTALRGARACETPMAGPRRLLASWSCLRAAWRPCRRLGITWGRWAVCARILWWGVRLAPCRILARVKHGVKHGVKHPRVVVEFSITTSLTRARVTPRMRVCDKLVSWLHRACWRRRCRRRSSSIRPSIFRTSRPAGPAKRVPLPRRGLWAWCVRGMGEVQARLGLVGARIARGWGARDGAQVVSPPGVM